MAKEKKEQKEKELQEEKDIEEFGGIDPKNVNLVDLIEKLAWKTILIELVKREKMDPWDIDLITLADKYLEKIRSLKGTDLRLPANAILASAILLKFKSRVLKLSSLDEDEKEIENRALTEEEKQEIEQLLPELQTMRKSREGKISLDELVEGIESMFEKSKVRVDKRLLKGFEKPEFQIPIIDINIEELVDNVFDLIKEKADSQGLLTFTNLVEGKSVSEIVDIFIPCLFLVNKGKINMWQEEFFGKIFISVDK